MPGCRRPRTPRAPAPPPRSPRPLARAPQAACPRCLRGAAPHRLLSFQPRWRRMARVWAQFRNMSGSCRRSRAPTPPAWDPPFGKTLIPPRPRAAAAGRSSGAGRGVSHRPREGRPDRWCARRRAGALPGGGPRPGSGPGGEGPKGGCTCRQGLPSRQELSPPSRWVWPPRRL